MAEIFSPSYIVVVHNIPVEQDFMRFQFEQRE